LKVSLFIPSLSSGGAERVMLNLANGLIQIEGLNVEIVLSEAKGQYLSQLSKDIKIIDLGNPRSIKCLPGLIKYLKENRPDIFISAITHTNIISIIAKMFAKSKAKLVVTEHSMVSNITNETNKLSAYILRNMVKLLYPLTDAVVAVSKTIKMDLINNFFINEMKIHNIYNPIFEKNIINMSLEEVDHPWFNNSGLPVILSVGRLTKAKDFPTLLKAFKNVRKTKDAKLVILGEGELRKELENLCFELDISDDVQMPGFVLNPYKYMSKSKVFVLTSSYEGFGNVIVEALACGTEVISTDCVGGPKEILEYGEYGTLVPVGDIETLTTEILKTLSKSSPPSQQKSLNRAMDFSIEVIIKKYLNLINNLQK
jgi:glycosyltransferase involved in cell wall biosynthesis